MKIDYRILSITFKLIELSGSILLSVIHVRTEFSVPQIGFGTNIEVMATTTAFSAMIVPIFARLQASFIQDVPFDKKAEMLFTVLGVALYGVGGGLTIKSWWESTSMRTIFFRPNLSYVLLVKGVLSCLLCIIFLAGAFVEYKYYSKQMNIRRLLNSNRLYRLNKPL